MWKEFKEFAVKGSAMDLAIGIIIGASFGKIVSSLVSDILMPPLGILLGKVDFTNLYINLSGQVYGSLAEAKAAGAATINYGLFINTVIDFVIVVLAVFFLVRSINRLKRKQAPAPAPSTRECPYCFSAIHAKARCCPHCTSALE